jgi:hypothetical protein
VPLASAYLVRKRWAQSQPKLMRIADSLRLCPSLVTAAKVSAALPFVIPSELRISCYAAPINGHVCGFLEESRTRFTEVTKPDRKSGGRRGTCSFT